MVKFDIVAPMSSADGYGYSAECLVQAAIRQGAKINFKCHDWVEDMYTCKEVLDLKVDNYDDSGIVVVYFIPYAFHHFRAEFQIGMTMFETTEIPDVWAAFCTIPKGLIVPSEFCKTVFDKKVNTAIEVAPLGVNVDTYHYVEREPTNTFTFLMAGLLHYRKGAEFAVRAFKEEFKQNEPVRLILKTRKGFLDVGKESLKDERIEVVNWNYTRDEMLDLYHTADCFIACSRGEASGLTPREAMATGLPVIATDWSGLREITDERYTYPIRIDGEEKAPIVCSSYSEGITQGQPIGNFAIPSVQHLRECMREVYEDREQARAKGHAASEWVAQKWNYDVCARIWLEGIEKIYELKKSTNTDQGPAVSYITGSA